MSIPEENIKEVNKIDKITYVPFTSDKIRKFSTGEITEQVTCLYSKGSVSVLETFRRYERDCSLDGNIFSTSQFPSKDHNRSESFNFGHIELGFPIVIPDKYADSKNQLKQILNITEKSDLLKGVIEYESCLLIPIRIDEEDSIKSLLKTRGLKISDIVMRLYSNHIGGDCLLKGISMNSSNDDENKYDLTLHVASNQVLQQVPEILRYYLPIQGAYAISYLLSLIDIEYCIDNYDKITSKDPASKEHLAFIKSTTLDKGKLTDIITDVVPVIPAIFRQITLSKQNNNDTIDIPHINFLYYEAINSKHSVQIGNLISYEELYTLGRTIMSNYRNSSYSDINTAKLNNLFLNKLEDIYKMGTPNKNKIREFQKLTVSHLISSNPTHNQDPQLERLSGKYGMLRDKSAAKRMDRTFRAVITANPDLLLNYVGVPFSIILDMYKPIIVPLVVRKFKLQGSEEEIFRELHHLSSSTVNRIVTKGKRGEIEFINSYEKTKDEQLLEYVMEKLNEIVKDKRVMIIRFPSLHKYNELGFKIRITRGSAVEFHPLVVRSYNADFDGDQVSGFLIETEMAVKDVDEKLLPMKNVTDALGKPLLAPSQEAVLGLYYLTSSFNNNPKSEEPILFPSYDHMYNSYVRGEISLSDVVTVSYPHCSNSVFNKDYAIYKTLTNIDNSSAEITETLIYNKPVLSLDEEGRLELQKSNPIKYTPSSTIVTKSSATKNITSTVGRFIFNSIIPQNLGFVDRNEDPYRLEIGDEFFNNNKSSGLSASLINKVLKRVIEVVQDNEKVAYIHDRFKDLGYYYATISGFSLSLEDFKQSPERKKIIEKTKKRVNAIKLDNTLSEKDKEEQIIELWMNCTEEITEKTIQYLPDDNPLKMMIISGARGSKSQISQLLGMRGIMKDASGNFIQSPILGNFIEGITPTDTISASYGACKGIIDKGNTTKDTGELTRNLILGVNDLTIKIGDCGDREGLLFKAIPIIYQGQLDCVGNLFTIDKKDFILRPSIIRGQTVRFLDDQPVLDSNGNIYAYHYTEKVDGDDIVMDNDYRQIPIFNIKHNRVLSEELFYLSTNNKHLKDDNRLSLQVSSDKIVISIKNDGHNFTEINIKRQLTKLNVYDFYIESINIINGTIVDNKSDITKVFDVSVKESDPLLAVGDSLLVGLVDCAFHNENLIYLNGEVLDNNFIVKLSPTEFSVKPADSNKYNYITKVQYAPITSDLYGRYLINNLYDEEGNLLVSADKMVKPLELSEEKFKRAVELHPEGIYVRSSITCKHKICAKCYGFNHSSNAPAKVGDAVGLAAAHTLGEYNTQNTLRTFHTGGAASAGDIGDTFKAIKNLLVRGKIDSKQMHKVLHINTNNTDISKSVSKVKTNLPKMYTYKNKIFASNLPIGEPLLGQEQDSVYFPLTMELLGICNYFTYINASASTLETIKMIFIAGGANIISSYFEIFIAKMFSKFIVVDGGDSIFNTGDSIDINELMENNFQLIKNSRNPIIASPKFTTISECSNPSNNPNLAMLNGHLKKNISNATTYRTSSSVTADTITAVLTGTSYPTGSITVKNSVKQASEELKPIKTKDELIEFMKTEEENFKEISSKMIEQIKMFGGIEFEDTYQPNIEEDDIYNEPSELDNIEFNDLDETSNEMSNIEFNTINIDIQEEIIDITDNTITEIDNQPPTEHINNKEYLDEDNDNLDNNENLESIGF